MRVRSLCWEDSLEKEMATHSSTLAWKPPWTEEPGGLQSMGLQRVRHNWVTKEQQQIYNSCLEVIGKSCEVTNRPIWKGCTQLIDVLLIYLSFFFLNLLLASLGLHWCSGYSLFAVTRLLTASCGAQVPGCGLSSRGAWALLPLGLRDLPGPGIGTHGPCIARWIANHWTTRVVPINLSVFECCILRQLGSWEFKNPQLFRHRKME